jgi:thiamine biosynthesis lipoprotein
MGSLLEITLYGPSPDRCRKALEAAFAEAHRLEGILSPFRPESDLSRMNQNAAQAPVQIDTDLFEAVQKGIDLARRTQGVLDMTAAPLLKLWGFRQSNPPPSVPTGEQIQKTLVSVGYVWVDTDPSQNTVAFGRKGMEIEFGAFGKGYAIDRVIEILKDHEIETALVNFGSTAYALGAPPRQTGWKIGITPSRSGEGLVSLPCLRDCAVSTSGNDHQGIKIQGKYYGHILDPRTGYPARGVEALSVVAPTAIEADAFSTAAFVLGAEKGRALLIAQKGFEGLFQVRGTNPSIQIATPGWKAFDKIPSKGPVFGRREFVAGLLATLGYFLIGPRPVSAMIYKSPEEAFRSLMPDAETVREETVRLIPSQKVRVEALLGNKIREDAYPFWIGSTGKSPIGYGVRLDVIGKERPITFLVIIGPKAKVIGVEVLVYRESQGSEIRSPRFMKQFTEKTSRDVLKLGRDIHAISGATLSSRSTAYAVKKALALVEVIYFGKE